MLRGSFGATVDDKGRVKIPARFRDLIRSAYGDDVFVTCLSSEGGCAHIYPLPVWERFEKSLSRIPLIEPARRPIEDAASYYGLECTMDAQGRVLISQALRKSAALEGEEACVLGKGDYLEVWKRSTFENARLRTASEADYAQAMHKLAQYPVWEMAEAAQKKRRRT